MTELEQACAQYLKERRDTRRIMEAMLERYAALSGVGGSIRIAVPTEGEREFLRGLFKRDFSEQKTISISLKKFEAAFSGTRFAGVGLCGVLEGYFGKPLTTNRMLKDREIVAWDSFFAGITAAWKEEGLGEWFRNSLDERTAGSYKLLMGLYKQDSQRLRYLLHTLEEILALLHRSTERLLLPVAAAAVTRDPHSLDDGTDLQKLLLHYLSYHFGISYPISGEERTDLLYLGGIINDMGTRQVMTYGLEAYDIQEQNRGWSTFFQRGEPLMLSLLNLEGINRVQPAAQCRPVEQVYCFENPAVFYSVVQACPQSACVCTSGQINTTAYRLLDMLAANKLKIWYAGDYDPEGLLIADRLKKRHPQQVVLLGYTLENYRQSLSSNIIQDKRLKQLSRLEDPALAAIAGEMQTVKKAGYQEYIIDALVDEMRISAYK